MEGSDPKNKWGEGPKRAQSPGCGELQGVGLVVNSLHTSACPKCSLRSQEKDLACLEAVFPLGHCAHLSMAPTPPPPGGQGSCCRHAGPQRLARNRSCIHRELTPCRLGAQSSTGSISTSYSGGNRGSQMCVTCPRSHRKQRSGAVNQVFQQSHLVPVTGGSLLICGGSDGIYTGTSVYIWGH